MKSLLLVSFSLGVAAFLAGCGQSIQQAKEVIPATLPGNLCVVSEEEVGSMGDAVEYNLNGHIVKVCCDSCIPDLKKHPEKYLAALRTGTPVGDGHSHGHGGHSH